MWYVYIIECKNKTFYTGMTNNLEQRFKRHLSKNGSYYTKYSPPLKIVYSEECSNKYDAAA